MTRFDHVQAIVDKITCLDRTFRVVYLGNDTITIHVEYMEPDIDRPGSEPVLQTSRSWLIGRDDTDDEIVRTCHACIRRSYMHVVDEHFTYEGRRVFSPHRPI